MADNIQQANTTATDTVVYATDYKLSALGLITSDGTAIDLTDKMVELNLYEDLFSPSMSGSILMFDGIDLLATFRLHGNEHLYIELDKPGLNQPIKKTFRVYKISDRRQVGPSAMNYIIHFCSEELFLSIQKFISKAYSGLSITTMIKDILKSKLGVDDAKINFMEETDGVFDLIIPRFQPFEAIQWLATRAYGANKSLFLFWETQDGFNFASYETLKNLAPYRKFYKSGKDTPDALNNIDKINFMYIDQDFDIIEAGRYGAFASTLLTYDFVGRAISGRSFNASQFSVLNDALPANDDQNRFGQNLLETDYLIQFYPIADSEAGNVARPTDWLQQKAAKLAQLQSFKMTATIAGDPALRAGMVIEVEVPQGAPQTEKEALFNKMRSGKFLVGALHHVIKSEGMVTVLELVSDSVVEGLFKADNNNQTLQSVKKN